MQIISLLKYRTGGIRITTNDLKKQYPQQVKQADVGQDKTYRWLKAAGLKAETEGFTITAQDQSLPTRWYQHNILTKLDVDPKCTLCG